METFFFTCNLESAFACSSLIDDITGVLAPAITIKAADGVLCLISLGVKSSRVEQPVREKPLEAQHTGGVGSQHSAGHHYRPSKTLTHLHENRLHCWRVWAGDTKAQESSQIFDKDRKVCQGWKKKKNRKEKYFGWIKTRRVRLGHQSESKDKHLE